MIKLRQVEDKDLIPLAELLAQEFPFSVEKGLPYTTKEFWLSLFELWWEKNPAYTDEFPRGWLLENDTVPVGFIGNIPVKFLVSGKIQIAASSNAWYVNPSVRGGSSLRLFNEFVKQKSPPLFLFKIEDESFIDLLSRYKFRHFILPKYQSEYVYIINKAKVKYIFLSLLSIQKPLDFKKILEICKKLGILVRTYVHQKSLTGGGNAHQDEYVSTLCTCCDDSFSRLWEYEMSSGNVSISRDTETLNWLYFSSSRIRKRVVIQCRRSSDNWLAGYMVFDVVRNKKANEATLQLMDMCIGDDDPRVLASLTAYAVEIGKENDASLLVVWGTDQQTDSYFRDMFPIRRQARYHRFIRFQDPYEKISGRDYFDNVRLTMIHPPQ